MARPPYLQRERAPRNSKHPERTPCYPKTICQSGPSHHYPTAATSAGRPAGEYSNSASAGAPLSRQIRPRRRARYFGESAQSWAANIPRYSTQSYLRGSRRAAASDIQENSARARRRLSGGTGSRVIPRKPSMAGRKSAREIHSEWGARHPEISAQDGRPSPREFPQGGRARFSDKPRAAAPT